MHIDTILLPRDLKPGDLDERCVVAFDVLRATTTMTAALEAGVEELRIFDSLDAARAAAGRFEGSRLLCGEHRCLPPPGFDLGNSPAQFVPAEHRGRTAFMSTTNGTRAIVAARDAAVLLIGALVNAGAVARAAASTGRDVTLLCAGTDGQPALEDLIGAGAVAAAITGSGIGEVTVDDVTLIARRLFESAHNDLPATLRTAQGGRNLLAVGLDADIAYAARLDVHTAVGVVTGGSPVVRRRPT